MDTGRDVNPLGEALRVVFVAVVAAAVIVDLWVMGPGVTRTSLASLGGIALAAAFWALWPQTVMVAATAAAALSAIATIRLPDHGLRFELFTEFVVLPVLFGVLLSGTSRWRGWVGGAVVVAGEAVALRTGDTPIRAILAICMFVLFGTAAVAVVYIRMRDNERAASIDRARQSERLELARELHDVVGHHVTGIVVLAQASRFTADAATNPQVTDRALAAIEQAGLETLGSIRRLVGMLRTDASFTAPPRLVDLEQLVDQLRSSHPLTDLVVDDSIRTSWVPDDLAITIHRLVQELMTNVRKHGDPTQRVTFALRSTGAIVDLTTDNASLHADRGEGFGITGMRERVDAMGGTFRAGTELGRWTVRIALPVAVIAA
ncbi:MAG: integral rane sensor signal transduction histidine kinase [Ilumatobacteraceae bacterium]|nr:integral rane sensor signal transduction histidine kinase [Ilumatobacteraceae bacterium]